MDKKNLKIKEIFTQAVQNHQNKKLKVAESLYEEILKINPDHAQTHNNMGAILKDLGEYEKAINSYEKAIKVSPKNPDAHNNLGVIFKELGQFHKAVSYYKKAIQINPKHSNAHNNLGNVFRVLGNFKEAIESHKQAAQLNPKNKYAIYNESMTRLTLSEFGEGWKKYEYRFAEGSADTMKYKIENMWDGNYLDGTLLIWSEQGIGDHILFASMIKDLKKIAKNIILQIDKRLIDLCKRYYKKIDFLNIKVVGLENKLEDKYDKHIAIGSLGQYLRKNKQSFDTTPKKYLVASSVKEDEIKKKYFKNNKFRIGLSWKTLLKKEQSRNVDLIKMLPFLSNNNCDFVNIQFGRPGNDIKYWSSKEILEDLKNIESTHRINIRTIKEIDNYSDIESLAALINCLDLIITIDNSNAHLAGALGKRTWVMLVKNPIWSWGLYGEKSLWYPNSKLFRQEKIGDWSNVINNINADISKLIEN